MNNAYIFIQTLVALALALAAVLQFAVIKAVDIQPDIDAKRAGRRVMILAMACASIYLFYLVSEGHRTDPPMVLFLGLIGLSQSVFGLVRLFPQEHNHGPNRQP